MTGQSPLWVGVDVGTQSVKVSVVDDEGTVVGSSSSPLSSFRDHGWHEQRPEDWIAGTRVAMAGALATVDESRRSSIGGLAICATSGTIAAVDLAGRPVSPGIMYDDARAAELTGEVAAAGEALWRRLGYRIQPTWALPKIVWALRQKLLSIDHAIAHQADVVASAMIGTRVATDWSHALKSGYDTIGLDWPSAALDALGVDARRLPEVVAPGTPLGRTSQSWAAATGVPAGTTVYAGMTDGCAAQLGAAAFGLGDWHSVIGTTLVVKGVSQNMVTDASGAVYSHRAPHDDLWLPGGASSAGAGVLNRVLPGADLEALTRTLSELAPGGLPLAYPLSTTGERFPVVRPDAEGFIVADGRESPLTADAAASPGVLLGSVLLGVALVERLSVETMAAAGVPVDGRFSSSGGGTRNPWWNQLRADLLGRPLVIPASAEGSVGMAILAAWAAGDDRLPDVAVRMSRAAAVIEPNDARRDELDETYGRFRDILSTKGWIGA